MTTKPSRLQVQGLQCPQESREIDTLSVVDYSSGIHASKIPIQYRQLMVKQTDIRLSNDQLVRLKALRKKYDVTLTEQIRRAVDSWLESEERKLIERVRAKRSM